MVLRISRLCVLVALAVASCSSGGSDGPPTDDPPADAPPTGGGIDGPASVDPDYDPFAVDGSVPPSVSRDETNPAPTAVDG